MDEFKTGSAVEDGTMKAIKAAITVILISALCLPVYAHNPFMGYDAVYTADFEGFEGGSKGYDGFVFWNQSKEGIEAVKIDDFHGTSAKIVDLYARGRNSYCINGLITCGSYTKGKYVFELELYPISPLTAPFWIDLYSVNKSGASVMTVFGQSIKAGGRSEQDLTYKGGLKLGRWSKVSVYIDLDEKKYTTYLDGRALESARDINLDGALTGFYFATWPLDGINHGDIIIDNICFYKTDKPINQDELSYTLTVDSGGLKVEFSDDISPSMFNKNNIELLKNGEKIEFEISDKSFRGFCAEPLPKGNLSEDAVYTVSMEEITGTGGGFIQKSSLEFPGAEGVYTYIKDPEPLLMVSVSDNEINVINRTGESRDYTLLIGIYKNKSLSGVKCFSGSIKSFEESTAYTIDKPEDGEIRAFVIEERDKNKYFKNN